MTQNDVMPTFEALDALVDLVKARQGLYVRWSRGPEPDLGSVSSKDDLTGIPMPGLSASPLDMEHWWDGRPVRTWVARRLHDYSHLPRVKDDRARPWVLHGREAGRGPDNEPLVRDVEPLGWIADEVISEACAIVERQPGRWGPLDRDAQTP